MNKAVLLSVQPRWCELIASGKKTVEVRKTRPKIDTSFKVYIYCTNWKDNSYWKNHYKDKLGKVIGEFICHVIVPISITYSDPNSRLALREFYSTGLTDKEIMDYLGNGKEGYGWAISRLVIYDKPKELSEFHQCHKCLNTCVPQSQYLCEYHRLKRPPQSWCYVEELK